METMDINGIAFHPLKADDKELFWRYIVKEKQPAIHQSFAYNFVLDSHRVRVLWKVIDGCLCIFRLHRKRVALTAAPLGLDEENCMDVLDKCTEIIEKVNGGACKVLCFNFIFDPKIEPLLANYELMPSLMGYEYIYDCNAVVSMGGSRFGSFRRSVRRFIDENKGIEVEINEGNCFEPLEPLKQLYQRWQDEWLNRGNTLALLYDKDDYEASLGKSAVIDQHLIVVKHGGDLIGMTGIVPLNADTCMCLNRKSMVAYRGLSEFLVYEVCRYAARLGYRYMDDSWDANQEGLKLFKKKMSPVTVLKLHHLLKHNEEDNG